ncbi:MAG: hypothetical protein V1725_03645 [archaeon]
MKKERCYEHFPFWIVVLANAVSLATCVIGAVILYQLSLLWLMLYLLFIVVLEFRLLQRHCVNCYYYGKTCAFGKGSISRMLFKKGDAKEFCKKQMSWKDIVPDFMISLVPMIIGSILLIKDFDLILLVSVLILFILTFVGNGIIRGQLACKYCKQRVIGCPAEQLFNEKKK